jgi:hypothetical protein
VVTIFGMSPARFAVNVGGGVAGGMIADRYVIPSLAQSFPRLFAASGDDWGWDDVVEVALILLAAMAANSLYSKAQGQK